MRKILQIQWVFLIGLLAMAACDSPRSQNKKSYVVVVSLDGFRWDYAEKSKTPTLDSIEKYGVKAKSLKPSFPTKTFPNHYALATGLYPDHHGIVQNTFYDPELDAEYMIRDREAVENPDFYQGEPIWVTAEKQGVPTASYFWVGSEAPIQGIQPSIWKEYQHNFPFEQRIDSVVAWLQLPEEKRPQLIMLYFHEPDHVGHAYGPDSPETADMVGHLDSLMGVLSKKLNELPVAKNINLIILSDHGMGNVSPDRSIVFDQQVDTAWFDKIMGHNPNLLLKVKKEFYDTAWKALQQIPHLTAWKHGQVPERLHYGTNPRTLDFIVVADSSWSISFSYDPVSYHGAHGYDNDNPDMHAIFYATGPDFKSGYDAPTFENVDIYPLLAKLLKIEPANVDGDLEITGTFIKK